MKRSPHVRYAPAGADGIGRRGRLRGREPLGQPRLHELHADGRGVHGERPVLLRELQRETRRQNVQVTCR